MIAGQKFDKENPPILACKADGRPKPTVIWYKDDERFPGKSGVISADRFTLRVKSLGGKYKSTYSCFVWNKYGNISYDFVIKVAGNYVLYDIPPISNRPSVATTVVFTTSKTFYPFETLLVQ